MLSESNFAEYIKEDLAYKDADCLTLQNDHYLIQLFIYSSWTASKFLSVSETLVAFVGSNIIGSCLCKLLK